MVEELPTSINTFLHTLLINRNTNETLNRRDSQRHKVLPLEATIILLVGYGVLCIISVFGNALVCYVIFKNKRLHTATNFFIANLAVSDLLVTFVNVPFNIARNLLEDWPLGEVPCHMVNYSIILTSYVSTYTLTSIALDRHRVVLKPLSRRMSRKFAISILILIWIVAICLSLPYGMYMRVLKMQFLITKELRRCRFISPRPWAGFEKFLTVTTFILQYCLPFTLIAVAYGRIVQSLWSRTHVGAVTANQQLCQARAKRKSIKLLIAVVIVFAICWLPLNMYHLLTDLHHKPETFQYNSLGFFACHWVAISSTCYNPFVYCWLNEHFREEVRSRFSCFYIPYRKSPRSDPNSIFLNGDRKTRSQNYPSSSCCHNIKRDPPTMATDFLKDSLDANVFCMTGPHKDSTDTDRRVDRGPAGDVDDDYDEMTTDCTDEAAQGLIVHIDCHGESQVAYHNGNKRT